jgi:hypothetical protein
MQWFLPPGLRQTDTADYSGSGALFTLIPRNRVPSIHI